MKDLSLFLLKNSLTAKLRKGFKSFCNGDSSTSTLNQQLQEAVHNGTNYLVPEESLMDPSPPCNNYLVVDRSIKDKINVQPTLEEMIMQLELEEKMAAKSRANLHEYDDDDQNILNHLQYHHRMSCVNSSDILRSARNALNQYPRFSLDGKDAMYRSSFGPPMRGKSKWCNQDRPRKVENQGHLLLPAKLGGERVVWCKAGVVAKLMGLDSMPVPFPATSGKDNTFMSGRRSTSTQHVTRHQKELMSRKRTCQRGVANLVDSIPGTSGTGILFKRRSSLGDGGVGGSCSKTGYCFNSPAVPIVVRR